jgi:ketosteroid isomerase-like protein
MITRTIAFFCRRRTLIALVPLLVTCAGATPPARESEALDSIIAAERAFAALSRADGVRAAFLANFAADGLMFSPGPVNARQALTARPAPADPLAVRLEWSPATGAVAASGDLGFTTGPFEFTDKRQARPPSHGVYFSIWRREAGGPWQVVVDAGITTPSAVSATALVPAPSVARTGAEPPGANGRPDSSGLEAPGVTVALAGDGRDDYADWFAIDGRLQRNGYPPLIGQERVRAYLHREGVTPARAAFVPRASGIASDGRLAWTCGALKLTERPQSTPPLDDGWYVHLWARDRDGRWRIIVATVLEADGPR